MHRAALAYQQTKTKDAPLSSPETCHGPLHSFKFWRNSDGTAECTIDKWTVDSELLGTLKWKQTRIIWGKGEKAWIICRTETDEGTAYGQTQAQLL